MRTRYDVLFRYGTAVAAVFVALVICLLLYEFVSASYLFVFLAASVFTVRQAGLGPAVFSIGFSAVIANYFFLTPSRTWMLTPQSALLLIIYIPIASVVVLLVNRLQSLQEREARQQVLIRESEDRVRTLVANMPVLVNVSGSKDASLIWNKEAERVTGYTVQDVAQHENPLVLLCPKDEDCDAYLNYWRAHRGDYRDWEVRIARKDGQERIISWSSAAKLHPIPGWNDWMIGVDVTERKYAEERTRILQRVAEALGEVVTAEQVADVIVSSVYEVLNVHTGTVYRLSPDGQTLHLLNRRQMADETYRRYREVPMDLPGPLTEAIRQQQPIYINTFEAYAARYPALAEIVRGNGTQSSACIPLVVHNRVLGGLSLSFPTASVLTDDLKALLLAVAQQCAQALDRAQLYETEQQAKERLAFLAEASAVLSHSLDLENTLEAVARLAVPRVADWCSLDLVDERGSLQQVALAHRDPDKAVMVSRLRRRLWDMGHGGTIADVAKTGEARVFTNISQEALLAGSPDDSTRSVLQQIQLKSLMFVPIRWRNRTVGVLSLCNSENERNFTPDDLHLAEELATRAGVAIENARLYAQTQQQSERLRVTLSSIGDAVIATDNSGRITFMNAIAEQVTGWGSQDAMGLHLNTVFNIINEETRLLVESPYDKVMQTGLIVGLANHTLLIRRDGREVAIDDSGAPIHAEDGSITGVIIVFRDIAERRRAETRTEALQEITAAFSKALTIRELASAVITLALPRLQGYLGMVSVLATTEDALELVGHINLSQPMLESYTRIPLDAAVVSAAVYRNGAPQWIQTRQEYTGLYPQSFMLTIDPPIQSVAVLPLQWGGKTQGVITVAYLYPQEFDDATRAFITAIAQQCEQALQRATLYEAERASRERLAFLAQAGEMLVSSLDYDSTLRHIVRLAVPRVADWCAIDLLDEDNTLRQLAVAHTDEEKEELVSRFRESRMRHPADVQGMLELIRQQQTQVFPNITPEMIEQSPADEEAKAILRQLNLRAAMYVPLYAHGRPMGLLSLGSSDSGRLFAQEDVRLAEELAQRAAVAIENARLFREAQQQRERLRVTLTSIGDAVIATDYNGRIIFLNPVAEQVLGWSAQDATGKPLNEVFQIISEDTGAIVESPYDKVMKTGAIVGLANHTLLIRRDGVRVPIDDSGAPIHDETGEVIGVIIVFRDIAERRREEIFAEALQRLTAAFSEAATVEQITAILLDQSLPVLEAQTGLLMLLNSDEERLEAVQTSNFPEVLAKDYTTVSLAQPTSSSTAAITGEPQWFETLETYEQRFQESGKSLRLSGLQSVASVPLRMQGRVIGVLSILYAQAHRFDAMERNFIVSLAQQCAQALDRAFIFQAEQQARLRAEEADQLKMRFLGMISHELRTPLTSIKGFATTLLATDVMFEEEQKQRFIEVIDQEADKLTELIDQLLDLTRLQANTLTIKPEPRTLQSVIEVARAQLETLTGDFRLDIDIPDTLPSVYVDAHRVAQVLVNLVGNASKFSPPGTSITIEARETREFVEVRVCDEGPGIPLADQDYVFEAFRQLETSGMPRKGAGLGLAISRALIEGHGGQIWIANERPVGTVIVFTVPKAS